MATALFQPFPMIAGRKAQVWRHQPQFRRPRHFHEEPEINVVVGGSGLIGIGDRTTSVTAGDVLFFQPGQDHVLLEASGDFDLFVMALQPELAERARAMKVDTATAPLPAGELPALADELLHLGEMKDATSHQTRLTELFKRLQPPPAGAHALSRRALRCVIAEPDVSGSALARRFRTTPSSVSRQFHRDLGLTLAEHRSRMRLIEFVRLVDQGSDLTRAAGEAHFGSYAQCHRVFRRALGCAPREYFAGTRALLNEATFASLEAGREALPLSADID